MSHLLWYSPYTYIMFYWANFRQNSQVGKISLLQFLSYLPPLAPHLKKKKPKLKLYLFFLIRSN